MEGGIAILLVVIILAVAGAAAVMLSGAGGILRRREEQPSSGDERPPRHVRPTTPAQERTDFVDGEDQPSSQRSAGRTRSA